MSASLRRYTVATVSSPCMITTIQVESTPAVTRSRRVSVLPQ